MEGGGCGRTCDETCRMGPLGIVGLKTVGLEFVGRLW